MESNLKFSDFMRISLDDNNLVKEELLDTIVWKCQCLPYDFCSMNDIAVRRHQGREEGRKVEAIQFLCFNRKITFSLNFGRQIAK